MSNIRSSLTRLVSHDDTVRVNEPERVDDDLSFHRLNGVNHDCHRASSEGLKRLLWGLDCSCNG